MTVPLREAVRHDPQEVLDYSMDWSNVLTQDETISSSAWAVVQGLATISNAYNGAGAATSTGTIASAVTTVWVLTASDGDVRLKNSITTSAGRQYERTGTLTVANA